ncbi:MAG: DUF3108 domain-containing protein [Acidobacteriota bacterium]
MELTKFVALSSATLAVAATWVAGSGAGKAPKPLLLETEKQYKSIPFREGEQLRFEINWKPLFLLPAFKAGELSLRVDKTRYHRNESYTISAQTLSEGMLKEVAGQDIRDYFESTIDGRSFRSYRFLHRKRQNERKRDLEVEMDYSGNRTLIREVDLASQPPQELRNESVSGLPAAVVDTLSVFYVARLRAMEPGDEYLMHLSDEGKIKDVVIRVEEAEEIKIALGRYETIKISTKGGIFKGGGNFRIWYTRDERRLPVKFEADVQFGKVYGQLTQLETPRLTKGLIRLK